MADRFCRCLHVHRPPQPHRSRGVHTPTRSAFLGVRPHVQEAQAGRYLEGGCGVTCIANGSPPRSSAPSLERNIYIYFFLIAPSTNRRSFEGGESPDRDPRISRKNNYFGEPNSVYSERTALKFDCRGCARAAHLHFEFLLTANRGGDGCRAGKPCLLLDCRPTTTIMSRLEYKICRSTLIRIENRTLLFSFFPLLD